MATITSQLVTYETKLNKAREDFINHPILTKIVRPEVDPIFLELFLIHFHALGVSMTKQVETWIYKTGEKCQEIGLTELGHLLCIHANNERGHDQMMINDTKLLVASWNKRRQPSLDAEEILAQPISKGVRNYIKLHEDVIASDTPFAQLAIELEIEGLSLRVGPILIKQCLQVLGSDVLQDLSFIKEHVNLDVSHSDFNNNQLDKLLNEHPEYIEPLIDYGQKALQTYAEFLCDCYDLAAMKLKSIQ